MNIVSVAMSWMLAAASAQPIACDLMALSVEQRAQHQALGERLRSAIVHTEELPAGFRFYLSPEVSIVEIAQWADLERRCCPFFEFTIGLGHDGGPAWVGLTGRRGVKAFVREMFVPVPRSPGKGGG